MKSAILTTLTLVILAGWVTHIVVTIQAQEWLFGIFGALIPFVGVLHGWATWLGYSWF